MDDGLKDLLACASLHGFTLSVAALVRAAEHRGIPWMDLGEAGVIQLGHGRHQKLLHGTLTSDTSRSAIAAATDKCEAHRRLSIAGLPVPRQRLVHSAQEAVRASADIGHPIVVKPARGARGLGISVAPGTAAEVEAAFYTARPYGGKVVVEEFIRGVDYRLLVVAGEVVAAAQRTPAHVVGDGRRSIAQLIDTANRDVRRGAGHENLLTRLRIDPHTRRTLALRGWTPDSIPPNGSCVWLRATANLSTGGTAVDVTERVHPDNIDLAVRAAAALGLDVAGVDFIGPEISNSWRTAGGAICEVNAAPGLRAHLVSEHARQHDVAGAIINMLFPPGAPCGVPIVRICGAAGAAAAAYLLAHILRLGGRVVGLRTVDGVFIDGVCRGDARRDRDASRAILADTAIDAAVFQTPCSAALVPHPSYSGAELAACLSRTTARRSARFAVTAATTLGISPAKIARGLRTFRYD